MDISVVITTYNRYTLLKRAINSVLNQTYKPKEIIVVDDGSVDNTKDIKKEFKDINYIYQQNRGISSARNKGIKEAKNNWIAFLDDDDEWLDEKLEQQKNYHDKHNLKISYTDEIWIKNNQIVNTPKKYKKFFIKNHTQIISYNIIAPSSILVAKKLFDDVGLFDEDLKICEDYDFFIRVAQKYPIGFVDKKLIKKYAHNQNQLGFNRFLDNYRIKALEKYKKDKDIKNELIKKYKIILNGASKKGDKKLVKEISLKLESLL